ncbi:hypothetical protein HZR81_13860 [Pseudomonas sp. LM13]|jgi:hypothetical protein|uniref:hypothetical protein n=1 Tax=Stutzerimonas kunmingensis TaxID=1211807 RepID=UPI002FCC9E67
MFEWFSTAVASANAAKEISKSLMTLRDEEMIRGRVFELTNSLMDLQQQLMRAQIEQMELVQKVQALEAERRENEQKRELQEQYALYQFPETGSYAYRLKPSLISVEQPEHYLCCTCWDGGTKAILQPRAYGFVCPKCSHFVRTKNDI